MIVRKRNLKVFTFAFLFITVMSFLLNYTHQMTMTTWDLRHVVMQFSKLFKYPRRPCSCRTCISELGHSLWFDQRFNSTMQPFLTSQNALIPEDSYRWWLVSGRRGYGPGFTRRLWCQASSDAEQIAKYSSCKKRFLSQLTRQAEVEESGRSRCCLARSHSEGTSTSSKLEKSLAELESEYKICKCQYCLFLPSLRKTRLYKLACFASDGKKGFCHPSR